MGIRWTGALVESLYLDKIADLLADRSRPLAPASKANEISFDSRTFRRASTRDRSMELRVLSAPAVAPLDLR